MAQPNRIQYAHLLPDTYKSLTIGTDIYTIYDVETDWGIMRILSRNGRVVGGMRRGAARELGLLLGGDQLSTVDQYAKARHTQEKEQPK